MLWMTKTSKMPRIQWVRKVRMGIVTRSHGMVEAKQGWLKCDKGSVQDKAECENYEGDHGEDGGKTAGLGFKQAAVSNKAGAFL